MLQSKCLYTASCELEWEFKPLNLCHVPTPTPSFPPDMKGGERRTEGLEDGAYLANGMKKRVESSLVPSHVI
jgi:hypothetical protein